jgi:hypothetical protein
MGREVRCSVGVDGVGKTMEGWETGSAGEDRERGTQTVDEQLEC